MKNVIKFLGGLMACGIVCAAPLSAAVHHGPIGGYSVVNTDGTVTFPNGSGSDVYSVNR